MLKVVFNKLPKVKDLYKYIKEKENITVSKNQQYTFVDADKILKLMNESVLEDKKAKKSKFKETPIVQVTVVNSDGIASIEPYSIFIDGNYRPLKKIIFKELDTTHIDPASFDNGQSDIEKEIKLLKEEIEKGYQVESAVESENAKIVKGSGLGLFNKFKSKKANQSSKVDGDKEVQTEQSIEENNTQNVLSTTDKKLPEEEANPFETYNTSEISNEEETPTEDEKVEQQEITSNDENIEEKSQSLDETIKDESIAEKPDEPEKEEVPPVEEVEDQHEVENKLPKVEIPKIFKKEVTFKLPEQNDYISKEVTEYLNVKEYERVKKENELIEQQNHELNELYLKLTKEQQNKIIDFSNEHLPTEDEINEINQKHIEKVQEEYDLYRSVQESAKNQTIEEKANLNEALKVQNKEQVEADIEHYSKSKNKEHKNYVIQLDKELDLYKKELEKDMNDKLYQYNNNLRDVARSRSEKDKEKLFRDYETQKNTFISNSTIEIIEILERAYAKYKKADLTHESKQFNDTLKEDLERIKQKAIEDNKVLEREKSIQAEALLKQKQLDLKNSDLIKLEREAQLEKDRRKAAEKETQLTTLRLKEKQLADAHTARMRELDIQEKSQSIKSSRLKQWIFASLLFILIALLALVAIFKPFDYGTANSKDNTNYTALAEESDDELQNISLRMYREHDSNGLSKLNAETDYSYVHFRNMLLNGTSEDITKSYESFETTEGITKEEKLIVLNEYMSLKQFDHAEELNKEVNDLEVGKQLAEVKYYQQMKAEVQDIIATSKDKENVQTAEKELEQINMILGE